ncbi:hypothetical protein BDV10DRAFT_165600 [Aspergillus recurvatus]
MCWRYIPPTYSFRNSLSVVHVCILLLLTSFYHLSLYPIQVIHSSPLILYILWMPKQVAVSTTSERLA